MAGGIRRPSENPATEDEVFSILRKPRIAEVVSPLYAVRVQNLFAAAELVTITAAVAACRDPLDDKFLELAVNGHADVIISGDADLLVLNPFRGIPIVTPAIFCQTW